jgi:transcriptional regulator with XRE-family HTH domain
MTGKELAEALGISEAMVSKLRKRGMPTDSVERAQRWRRRHLEPTRVKGVRAGTAPSAVQAARVTAQADVVLIEVAHQLGDLAQVDPDRWLPELRAAMQRLPRHLRPRLHLEVDVWRALLPAAFIGTAQGDPADDTALTEAQAAHADDLLFELAAGLRQWHA